MMTPSTSVETIFPRIIDNTMYSDWRACPHRFWRRHLQGLNKPRANVHLHFGGCFASALERARLSFCEHRDHADAVKDGCEEFIRAWGDYEVPDGATRSEQNKTLAAGLVAIQDYFREWPMDVTSREDAAAIDMYYHDGKPAIEFGGAAPIPGSTHPDTGEPIIYCGRFDMIGRVGERVLGLDDKTTSSLGEHWRNQWKLRSQFTGYVWLAEEYGVRLDGFRIRGTAILKTQVQFDYVDVPRPPWMVDRWLATLQSDVEIMCDQYDHLKDGGKLHVHDWGAHSFPQNFDHACSDFNGCAFLDLCTSEHPDNWLTEYVVDRWDPSHRPGA